MGLQTTWGSRIGEPSVGVCWPRGTRRSKRPRGGGAWGCVDHTANEHYTWLSSIATASSFESQVLQQSRHQISGSNPIMIEMPTTGRQGFLRPTEWIWREDIAFYIYIAKPSPRCFRRQAFNRTTQSKILVRVRNNDLTLHVYRCWLQGSSAQTLW